MFKQIAAAVAPIALIAFGPAQAQQAASPVTLTSDVGVERTVAAADGSTTTIMKSPKEALVVPGDKLLFTLSYVNTGASPAAGFRAVNPIPAAVQFTSVGQDWAELSVDGGKTFGKLATLTVELTDPATGAKSRRAATEADVTHIRWVFPAAIPAGAKGELSYRAVVR